MCFEQVAYPSRLRFPLRQMEVIRAPAVSSCCQVQMIKYCLILLVSGTYNALTTGCSSVLEGLPSVLEALIWIPVWGGGDNNGQRRGFSIICLEHWLTVTFLSTEGASHLVMSAASMQPLRSLLNAPTHCFLHPHQSQSCPHFTGVDIRPGKLQDLFMIT